MTRGSRDWAEPLGATAEPLDTVETRRHKRTGLAEAIERATSSRVVLVRAAARLALSADARFLPLARVLRSMESRLPALAESTSPATTAIVRRGLLAVSATMIAAAGIGTGIIPGSAALDLASRGSSLDQTNTAARAAAFHTGRASAGELPTTPPPGLDVATLAPPLPGSAPNTTAPTTTVAPLPPSPYVNPLAYVANLQPKRIDGGVDYSGAGPLLALGSGIIRITTESGWPGGAFIALQLDHGQLAGQVVYYAENVTPAVAVGQHVKAGDVVGILHDAYPNLEIGWGGGGRAGGTLGDALARSTGGAVEGVSSAVGVNFNQLLMLLGAPSGIQQGIVGHLPLLG